MLGIRHFKHCAIDLWVGEASIFETDRQIMWPPEITENPLLTTKRHLSLVLTNHNQIDCKNFFETICRWVENTQNFAPSTGQNKEGAHFEGKDRFISKINYRITVICPSLEIYFEIQSGFFKFFPEST
jgi:hypothetical protein